MLQWWEKNWKGGSLLLIAVIVANSMLVRSALQADSKAAASPEPVCGVCVVPLSNIEVTDGDTIKADIDMPLRISLKGASIRCDLYDAWESSKRRRSVTVTDEEVIKGKRAAEALKAWLKTGRPMLKPQADRDSYGRVLGTLYIEKQGVLHRAADYMRQNGHLRSDE